jgi:BirA family biotin operon repressor/biotin-[acetyl-CoA-carboxylase] ligase
MVKTYVGQKIIHLASVDSTNNYTAKLVKDGKIDSGAVILSDIQTEGRGQRSNSWQSRPFENLTFSFTLKPNLLNNISSITINHCVSLALFEFIKKQGCNPQLKWPNDIYVNNLKIAGILIENNFNSGQVINSIIGVGVNINQQIFDSLKATSLSLLTGKNYDVKGVLFDIIYHLNRQFNLCMSTSSMAIKETYDLHLWKSGEIIQFTLNDELTKGMVKGTNEEGSLLIELDQVIVPFRNGEITIDVSGQ